MGIFGKSKKTDVTSDIHMGNNGLELPPPPIPPPNTGSDLLHSIEMPAPEQPVYPNPAEEEMPKPAEANVTGPKEQEFPGLDKEWIKFANNNPPLASPSGNSAETEKLRKGRQESMLMPGKKASISRISNGPIFVDGETYNELLGEVGRLNVKLHLMDEMLLKMNTLREKEETEVKRWHQGMEDIRRKLMFMDDALFEIGR